MYVYKNKNGNIIKEDYEHGQEQESMSLFYLFIVFIVFSIIISCIYKKSKNSENNITSVQPKSNTSTAQ